MSKPIKPWTEEEEQKLAAMVSGAMTAYGYIEPALIAKRLGRSSIACIHKAKAMGLKVKVGAGKAPVTEKVIIIKDTVLRHKNRKLVDYRRGTV